MGLISLHNSRNKYIVVLSVICLLPISVITYTSNIAYKKYLVKSVGEQLQFLASETAYRVNGLLFEDLALLQEIGLNPVFKDPEPSRDEIDRVLLKMKRRIGKDRAIFYMDSRGKIIASSDKRVIGKIKSEEGYFKIPFTKGGDFISGVYEDPKIGRHFLISTRVLDERENPVGVLALRSSLTSFEEISYNMRTVRRGVPEIIDAEGNIVVESNDEVPLKRAPTMLHSVREAIAGRNGYTLEKSAHGIDSIIGYANTKLGIVDSWSVLVYWEEKEALASFNAIWRYTWMAFFVIIFITLGATLYLSKRLTAPVVNLSEAAQAMTSGDMTKRIVVDREDEIGALGNAFNLMSDAIMNRVEALNNVSAFLRNIIIQSPFSTWISDDKGTCMMVNKACMKLFGVEKEEDVIGKYNILKDNVLIEQGYLPEIEKVFKGKAIEITADYDVSKVRHIKAVGGRRTLRGKIFPIIDSHGKVTNAVIMHEDVTEKKMLEAALIRTEKLSAMGTLAAGVAHEVNNPLTSILGYTSLLKTSTDASADMRKKLGIIEKEAIRARGIIRALLDFARNTEVKLEDVSLDEIMDNIFLLVQEDVKKYNIKVLKDYKEAPKVLANRNQIMQVFLNMINNAIQAMPDGGELKVITGSNGNEAFVRFSDTGVGIPKENLTRIFDPFFTTKDTGIGLGLSVSYGIVENFDGRIEVSNNKERGATFTVRLPIKSGVGTKES